MFSTTSTYICKQASQTICNKFFSKHLDSVKLIQSAENAFIRLSAYTEHTIKDLIFEPRSRTCQRISSSSISWCSWSWKDRKNTSKYQNCSLLPLIIVRGLKCPYCLQYWKICTRINWHLFIPFDKVQVAIIDFYLFTSNTNVQWLSWFVFRQMILDSVIFHQGKFFDEKLLGCGRSYTLELGMFHWNIAAKLWGPLRFNFRCLTKIARRVRIPVISDGCLSDQSIHSGCFFWIWNYLPFVQVSLQMQEILMSAKGRNGNINSSAQLTQATFIPWYVSYMYFPDGAKNCQRYKTGS